MTRLSCHRFRANEVRLWLSVIAYNLGNLWRRPALPAAVANWSLTSLQQRLVKTGGRLIKHARYYWLLLAESQLTRRLFGGMLQRIVTLPVPAGQAARRAQLILMTTWGREKCLKFGRRSAGFTCFTPTRGRSGRCRAPGSTVDQNWAKNLDEEACLVYKRS
jgi:hypothetical protein